MKKKYILPVLAVTEFEKLSVLNTSLETPVINDGDWGIGEMPIIMD